MEGLPDDALVHVAAYFQALSEPTRLRVLNLLRERPHGVGELAQRCGFSAANISRHLSLLMQHGLVDRESRGTAVIYRIADPSVYALCDLVCGNIARQLDRVAAGRAFFAAPPGPAAGSVAPEVKAPAPGERTPAPAVTVAPARRGRRPAARTGGGTA